MRRSRLTKRTEKNTRKTIFLSILGIIIVLFLLFKFGLGLLVNFSLFVSGSKNQQSNTNTNSINFIAAPVLDPTFEATNSAQVTITGKADKDKDVYLYINNSEVDQVISDDKGNFKFIEKLNKGNNQINAKIKIKDKESDFSNTLTINFLNSQPKLDVSSPSDGAQFKKDQNTANVTGATDSGVSVTVNGFWAQIDDANNFSYVLHLQNGDNQIKIIATDQAGNKTEKDIKVNYSQ
jgi:bacillopeptidase F